MGKTWKDSKFHKSDRHKKSFKDKKKYKDKKHLLVYGDDYEDTLARSSRDSSEDRC